MKRETFLVNARGKYLSILFPESSDLVIVTSFVGAFCVKISYYSYNPSSGTVLAWSCPRMSCGWERSKGNATVSLLSVQRRARVC